MPFLILGYISKSGNVIVFIELTFFGLEWVVGRKVKINKILIAYQLTVNAVWKIKLE